MTAASHLERYRRDPVGFCREVLGFEAWSKQRAILESVRDHKRTAVRSAHGVGKTAVAARACLWWLSVWPDSVVVTTSATWNQVREQLWREIAVGFHASRGFIDGTLSDTRLELGPGWFGLGLSTDTPERFAGYHADRLLVVLDEASGCGEATWEAAETLVTTPGSSLLAIGNPTRVGGAFHRAFTSERDLYATITVSAFDSPAVSGERVAEAVRRRLVSSEWIESRRRAWGEGSPLWQVRVMGEFPSQSDDVVVSLGDLEAAQKREAPGFDFPLVVACDVARFGSDSTVIATRVGQRARISRVYGGRDTMRTVGEILRVGRELRADRRGVRVTVVVDDVGVGGGVTDRLREVSEPGVSVVAFNGASRPRGSRAGDYPNRRSQAWFELAEQLAGVDLDADEELAADLLAPRYSLDSQGRRVVELKSETKKRLRRSPDRGDAIVMLFAVGRAGAGGSFAGVDSIDAAEPDPRSALRLRRERALARLEGDWDAEEAPFEGGHL